MPERAQEDSSDRWSRLTDENEKLREGLRWALKRVPYPQYDGPKSTFDSVDRDRGRYADLRKLAE